MFCDAAGRMWKKNEVKHPLWRACRRAGLRQVGWHVLRHTFASHLVMAGVDLRTVQELLGHRDPKMVMRYAHLSPAHKAAAVAKLTAALTAVAAEEPTVAVANAELPAPVPANPARFRHAPSGRQTPAKRKYLEDQRLEEWRRGESNPRPKVPP